MANILLSDGKFQKAAGAGTDADPHVPSVAIAAPSSEAVIGQVLGAGALVTPTVTVSTTPAYAAGDSVGGKLTLTSAVRVSGGITLLQSVVILDRANQKPAGTLLIFDSDPSAATITDNAAFVYSTDDLKVVAMVPVATTDYITINSKAIANIRNIGAVVKAASGTTLYAAFVLTSTPTFAATTNVQIELGFIHVN